MRAWRSFAALPALALLMAGTLGPTAAWASGGAPFELMRELESLQNQAAEGNAQAYAVRPQLIGEISDRLLAADPAVWSEPKNQRAVISYVLDGGRPAVLRKLAGLGVFPKEDEKLVNGAIAYAEGRVAEAKALLGDIDPRDLSPSLGGQLALVQSTLIMNENRPKALGELDLARLLMPGTLVEDVALRRGIIAYAQTGELDKFMSLSEQYTRRFPHSVYAGDFIESFSGAMARLAAPVDAALLERLEGVIAQLAAQDQRNTYLAIARSAILRANVSMARFAAEQAVALSQGSSRDMARAKLYQAAALIVTSDYDAAVAALDGASRTELSPKDRGLREAVENLSEELHAMPHLVQPKTRPDGKPNPDATAQGSQATTPTTISLAQQQIAAVDQLLQGGPP